MEWSAKRYNTRYNKLVFGLLISPVIRPATASFIILNGFGIWNNYAQAVFFLQSRSKQNVPQALSVFFRQFAGAKWYLMASAAAIAIVPVVVIVKPLCSSGAERAGLYFPHCLFPTAVI